MLTICISFAYSIKRSFAMLWQVLLDSTTVCISMLSFLPALMSVMAALETFVFVEMFNSSCTAFFGDMCGLQAYKLIIITKIISLTLYFNILLIRIQLTRITFLSHFYFIFSCDEDYRIIESFVCLTSCSVPVGVVWDLLEKQRYKLNSSIRSSLGKHSYGRNTVFCQSCGCLCQELQKKKN